MQHHTGGCAASDSTPVQDPFNFMPSNSLRSALLVLAACALTAGACAQNATTPTPCPPAQDMKTDQLFGAWAAHFTKPPPGMPERATVVLKRHAEFADSLSGVVTRDFGSVAGAKTAAGHAAEAALAGDLDEGVLILDESSDRIRITGTWNGEMAEGSCGRVFQGVWKDTSGAADNAPEVPFTLTRLP